MTISVLAIVFCAPLGGMFIMNLGPILLDNSPGPDKEVTMKKKASGQLPASESRQQLNTSSSMVSMEEEEDSHHHHHHITH